MRIDSLTVENFRCFEKETWEFAPGFNVFIGDNGSGKTAVISALAVVVGALLKGVPYAKILHLQKQDLRQKIEKINDLFVLEISRQIKLGVNATFGDSEIEYGISSDEEATEMYRNRLEEIVEEMRSFDEMFSEIEKLRHLVGMASESAFLINKEKSNIIYLTTFDTASPLKDLIPNGSSLPLIVYYSAGRAWIKPVEDQKNLAQPLERAYAYKNCLDSATDDAFLYDWFITRELANRQKGMITETMEGVRSAVVACLGEEWEQVWYEIDLGEIMAKRKDGTELPIRLLSDGQRSILAMGLDMAYRSAVLNPHLGGKASQETPGVVLIDELDLHLHPNWQRTIVPNLRRAFPKVQFFVTTHSPIIIQNLDPKKDRVFDLTKDEEFPLTERSSPEDILKRMGMEIPQQSADWLAFHKTAKEYYALLEEAKETRDEARLAELRQRLDVLSIPFTENPAWAAFLEMKRAASGIDSEDTVK